MTAVPNLMTEVLAAAAGTPAADRGRAGAGARPAARADPEPAGRSARAYLAASAGGLWQSDRWLALVGALVVSPGLLGSWRASVVAGRAADETENADPVAAAIVRLAADGLWLAGVLGLPAPDTQLRAAILAELDQMTRKPRPTPGGPQ